MEPIIAPAKESIVATAFNARPEGCAIRGNKVRDFSYIHAEEDVADVLGLASELGLIIRNDEPTAEPAPNIVAPGRISSLNTGIFMAYLPEWVFGDFKYNLITAGHNKGKYDQMPSTNCIKLQFSFWHERKDGDFIRLGNGTISRDIEWYRPEDHTVHPAPPEVKAIFDTIRKRIDTKKYIKVGGRRYAVLPGALKKLADRSYRPPFDFMDEEPIHGLG
jgi:hypothetical protein